MVDGIPVRVLLTPAKRTEIFTEDDIDILKEATTSANGNLYYKHKCWVEVNEEETVVDSNVVILTFYEPAEAPVFNLGNHLRGISAYVNRNYPEVASKFKSGTRMFFYIRTV